MQSNEDKYHTTIKEGEKISISLEGELKKKNPEYVAFCGLFLKGIQFNSRNFKIHNLN